MSLRKHMKRIRRLDGLIRRKSTGPPKELADRLDISKRWLFKLLRELREEWDCPIAYNRCKQSYVYEEKGKMLFGFQKRLSENDKIQTSGGFSGKYSSLYLFVQLGKL